jgi:hypothetical protein
VQKSSDYALIHAARATLVPVLMTYGGLGVPATSSVMPGIPRGLQADGGAHWALMTLEVFVIAGVRIAGSLPVLRWPLAGAILALLVDLSDLLLMDALDLGGVPDYQRLDKILDLVYMIAFLVVALRWTGLDRAVAVVLFGWRMIGFVAFELTGERALLLLFPNVFESWFLLVALLHLKWDPVPWTPARLSAALGLLLVLKEVQEWALHWARLFDNITALDAIDQLWRRVTGG